MRSASVGRLIRNAGMRCGFVVRTDDHAADGGSTFRLRRGQNTACRYQRQQKCSEEYKRAFHNLRLLPRVRPFLLFLKTNRAGHTAFLTFSLDLGSSRFDGVSFFVTHGVPAFSDRSAGANSFVNSRVAFQHVVKIAKLERPLPCNLPKPSSEGRIIQNPREFSRKRRGIASTKREAAFPEHFDEGAEVGGDHRQAARHILGNNQTENFST